MGMKLPRNEDFYVKKLKWIKLGAVKVKVVAAKTFGHGSIEDIDQRLRLEPHQRLKPREGVDLRMHPHSIRLNTTITMAT